MWLKTIALKLEGGSSNQKPSSCICFKKVVDHQKVHDILFCPWFTKKSIEEPDVSFAKVNNSQLKKCLNKRKLKVGSLELVQFCKCIEEGI